MMSCIYIYIYIGLRTHRDSYHCHEVKCIIFNGVGGFNMNGQLGGRGRQKALNLKMSDSMLSAPEREYSIRA